MYENKRMKNLVENFDNYSEGEISSLFYEDTLDKNKKDRIK
jgi:hypothetical protein